MIGSLRILEDGSLAVVVWNGGEILPRIERTRSINPLPDVSGNVTSDEQLERNRLYAHRRRMYRKNRLANERQQVNRRAARNRAAAPEWMR